MLFFFFFLRRAWYKIHSHNFKRMRVREAAGQGETKSEKTRRLPAPRLPCSWGYRKKWPIFERPSWKPVSEEKKEKTRSTNVVQTKRMEGKLYDASNTYLLVIKLGMLGLDLCQFALRNRRKIYGHKMRRKQQIEKKNFPRKETMAFVSYKRLPS